MPTPESLDILDGPRSKLPDGMTWSRVYWVKGKLPKNSELMNEVTDPPCSGWSHAVLLPGPRLTTLFCPYSMTAYMVSTERSLEAAGSIAEPDCNVPWLVTLITRKWAEFQGHGLRLDYDTAALILRRLGAEVPPQVMHGGEEDTRRRGGKEVGGTLTKAVKRFSKRGRFLEWFLDGEGHARSVRETMAEFSMTRSNALSYLYMLQKDHGIGYELVGDVATVTLPDDCSHPFDDPPPVSPTAEEDDSWLD